MRRDGVLLEDDGGVGDDYVHLVTTDAEVARRYGMVDEDEFWGIDEDEEETEPGSNDSIPRADSGN